MRVRALLGVVATGLALASLPLWAWATSIGVVAAVVALLLACRQTGQRLLPSPGAVRFAAATLAALVGGAAVLVGTSPHGFFWLLGPGFLLAAPLFLLWFGRGFEEP